MRVRDFSCYTPNLHADTEPLFAPHFKLKLEMLTPQGVSRLRL